MRTRLRKWSLWLGAAVLALPLTSSAQLSTEQLKAWESAPTAVSHIGNITGHAKDAAAAYRRYCVGCHGELGDGNGEVAQWLDPPMYPKPRDFQLGIFKCRSTPSGTLPTDDDLFDTIARGLDRSSMPQWSTSPSRSALENLVAWVKHFSPRWANEKPGTPITIPPEPEVTPERIKAGAVLSLPACSAGSVTELTMTSGTTTQTAHGPGVTHTSPLNTVAPPAHPSTLPHEIRLGLIGALLLLIAATIAAIPSSEPEERREPRKADGQRRCSVRQNSI